MEPSIPRTAVLVAAMAAVFGPAAHSQSPDDSTTLLDRAREKIARTTQRLLKCTCLETIERTYYVPPAKKVNANVMTEATSCDGKEFEKNGPLSLDAKDRLRLDVVVAESKETYFWAAANRFDSR